MRRLVLRLFVTTAMFVVLVPIVTASAARGDLVERRRPKPPTTTMPSTEPASMSFITSVSPGNTSGWSFETSDPRNTVTTSATGFYSTVGGFQAATHYARIRSHLPEAFDVAPRGRFRVTSEFTLPADYYTRQQSYMRWITTDNYPGIMKNGATVGALTDNEWRVGFLVYGGDQLPRLISSHETHEELVLWTGTQPLPVGRHTVTVDLIPSKTAGAFSLTIDGIQVGAASGIRTVPLTLADSEVVVTRVGGGIDGAASQSTQQVSVEMHSLVFAANVSASPP